jgi:SAM-dependent methyltransferase
VAENTYDTIPYPTFPRLTTHPDRMAAVALLFGMEPAPVDRCRVLEIGCGSGGNLVPMAYALPQSSFLGIDLAASPIALARDDIRALGLANIEVEVRDLRDLGPEAGQFDYVIAHGVYSWVPEDARDRLVALCRQRLAPSGVALISYNLYPGRHVRQMLREMMLQHTRDDAPQQRVERARWFLEWLSKSSQARPSFRKLVEDDMAEMLAYTDGDLAHDDLSPDNYAPYFRDFMAHAAFHGLQYLGDSSVFLMFDSRGLLKWLPYDRLEREQYTDYLYLRAFRHTLLCGQEVALRPWPGTDTMERLCFSAPGRIVDGLIEGGRGIRISNNQPSVEAVALAMGARYPLPVTFQELLSHVGSAEDLRQMLYVFISTGFALCHAYRFPYPDAVSERPRASALARHQAERSLRITSVIHAIIEMDEFGRRLLLLLDGTRDRAALARDLALSPEEIATLLPDRLQSIAANGLLEA